MHFYFSDGIECWGDIYSYFCGGSGGDGGSTVGAHSRHWVLVVQHPDDGGDDHLVVQLPSHHNEGDFDDVVL